MANPMWADRHIRLNNKGTSWAVVLLIMVILGIIVPFSFANPTTPFLVLCGIFGLVFLLFARVCFGSIVNGTLPSYEWLTCPE